MGCSNGDTLWKGAAISGYLGMIIGALVVTAVVPLTVICLGETDLQEGVAERSASFMPFSYWLIGIGGITFFVSSLAVIASFATSRGFRIFILIALVLNVCAGIALFIWGLIPTDERKTYMKDAWDEADQGTKNLIQNYYSCCGFESYTEYRLMGVPRSCYTDDDLTLIWPEGCYDRITSVTVPKLEITLSGDDVAERNETIFHVFLTAYLLPLAILISIQIVTVVFFVIGAAKYSRVSESESHGEVYRNNNTEGENTQESTPAANGQMTSNNSTDKLSTVSMQVDVIGQPPVAHKDSQESENGDVKPKSWLQKIPDAISSTLENGFYWLGEMVGRNPERTIALSLLVTAILFIGLLQRREQPSGSNGFLPEDSQIIQEYIAYRKTFPVDDREQVLLVVDRSNILTPENLAKMWEIDKRVRSVKAANGGTFSMLCTRVAVRCKERSLFELWNYNETVILQLSTSEILEKINGQLISPVLGDKIDITTILGGVERNSAGEIISAKAHRMYYVVAKKDNDWKKGFIEVGTAKYDGIEVYVESRGSRAFEARDGYQKELPLLFAGFGLIFIYVILMTGRFSLLEHRTYIALMGVTTAGLSMGSGIGLSAAFGFEWSVIHLVAPFLVIGIGVDDMFILIQSWNTIEDDPKLRKLSLAERSGHALKSAGVSITVTSVTDLVAFAVGSSSELSSFASFSIYVAVCIILLFFLQCTFFLACTVLDQKRREKRYDACLACCYKHDESYEPSECSKREFFATFFEDVLGRAVQHLPVQIIVILLTLGLTGFMGWGFTMLKVGFDPNWYLPQESYLIPFGDQYDKYFSSGQDASVFVIGANFYEEREKLHLLYLKLKGNPDLNSNYVTSWFEKYAEWMNTDRNVSNIYTDTSYANSQAFYATVNQFLMTNGRVFSSDVVIRRGIIVGSRFEIQHREVSEKIDNVDIMDSVHDDCDSVGFSSWAFPFHRVYFNFHIMKVIRTEVYRNLGITLLCVFIMVLPMIASIQMSFWVVICVVFTIIDVAGSMYFASLTIETSTIITLLLSVGLAVDYAAHIAHKYLTLKGSRKMRARVTLGQIGPAVFNGGFSTFLALVLLAGTDTYSYKVFFTVFVCVVAYGLWNGLIFLPCVLGLAGPPPHITAVEARLSERHQIRKNKIRNEAEMTEIQNPYIERS